MTAALWRVCVCVCVCVRANHKEDCIAQADEIIDTYINGILAILDKLGYTQPEITRLAGVFKVVEERNVSHGGPGGRGGGHTTKTAFFYFYFFMRYFIGGVAYVTVGFLVVVFLNYFFCIFHV